MTKLIIAIAALSFLAVTTMPAKANCPPGTSYQCTSTWNGKQSCGCR
jgi:hypothetical protein